ncbi:Pollen Ole e 1 allergen/extensin [Macleaya cordata]|uniref:Pollen Ole e 1 allergen/extensin n=1 Tax=Macleaya cordata TaxID=56857 RepID=A0A200QK27_MACCD|nr:Pollen Ole e 1 allergen/extensin [Macleaya cordata]
MAKFSQAVVFLAAALCFLSVAYANDFHVEGKIYCDTCRAGFETEVTEPIKGAKVLLECRDREGGHLTFTADGETDEKGIYSIAVDGDHEEEVCEVEAKESPRTDCNTPVPGRSRGRVLITANNGIPSPVRFVNSLGFLKKEPLASCPKVIAALGLTPEDIMVSRV